MVCRTFGVLCLFIFLPGIIVDIPEQFFSKTTDPNFWLKEQIDGEMYNSEMDLDSRLKSFADDSFPIIMYAMYNTDEAFAQVKDWGVTHVHQYGMGKSIEEDQAFFDRAEKHDMKVMSDLRAIYWLKEDKSIESFHEYITHFREHPALGFWYLSDEPDNKGFTPGELNPLYESLQKKSHEIAVANAHAWSENWYEYGNVQDILMYDNYPVYAGEFPGRNLKSWTNFTKSAIKQGKKDNDLVIPILQIFNWKVFADKEQSTYRNHPVEELRYPNCEELRYMVFSSIALGARGISLFSYARSMMDNPSWSNKVLAPVLKETRKFAEEIGDIKDQKNALLKDSKLFSTSWTKDTDYIMFVNATSDSQTVKFRNSEEVDNIDEYKPWGQTRKTVELTLKGRQVSVDNAEPWEIIILEKNTKMNK